MVRAFRREKPEGFATRFASFSSTKAAIGSGSGPATGPATGRPTSPILPAERDDDDDESTTWTDWNPVSQTDDRNWTPAVVGSLVSLIQ